jgi:hypothetical protein
VVSFSKVCQAHFPVALRPLRFVVHVQAGGRVKAKAVDAELEFTADSVAELREKLHAELAPFGYSAALLGIRGEPEKPTA